MLLDFVFLSVKSNSKCFSVVKGGKKARDICWLGWSRNSDNRGLDNRDSTIVSKLCRLQSKIYKFVKTFQLLSHFFLINQIVPNIIHIFTINFNIIQNLLAPRHQEPLLSPNWTRILQSLNACKFLLKIRCLLHLKLSFPSYRMDRHNPQISSR